MRNVVPRLYQLFSHEDRLLILIDPDPDAIASALALKRLLWHRLNGCIIAPIRPITRPQLDLLFKSDFCYWRHLRRGILGTSQAQAIGNPRALGVTGTGFVRTSATNIII